MKNKSLILIAAMTLLVAGCSSDKDPINPDPVKPVAKAKMTISASISESAQTKTELGTPDSQGAYTPVWSEGDKIGVFFDGGTIAVPFTLISGAGTSEGVFEGEDCGTSYQAFYPYDDITGPVGENGLSLYFPASQEYTEGSFAPDSYPMVSDVSTSGKLSFTNLFSFVEISLTGEMSVNEIQFWSNNFTGVSGYANLDLSSKTLTFNGQSLTHVSIEVPGIVLDPEKATSFFLTIPSQTYAEGFSIQAYSDALTEPVTKIMDESVTFSRSKYRTITADIPAPPAVIDIPDDNFRAYILEHFDANEDGVLTQDEADLIKEVSVSTLNIESVEGIEHFPNLEKLTCCGDLEHGRLGKLKSLDVSHNAKLTYLDCCMNGDLPALCLSENPDLTYLMAQNCNSLTTLDVTENAKLTYLNCIFNSLSSMNVSQNPLLETLIAGGCANLASLDVTHNPKLTVLNVERTNISSINLSQNTLLEELDLQIGNLSSVDLTYNTKLTSLMLSNNKLTSVDLSKLTALKLLVLLENPITSLDLSKNTELLTLNVAKTLITSMDLSKNTKLSSLNITQTPMSSLDLSGLSSLAYLFADNTSLEALDLSHNTALQVLSFMDYDGPITSLDLSRCPNLNRVSTQYSPLETLYLKLGATFDYFAKEDETEIVYVADSQMEKITQEGSISL